MHKNTDIFFSSQSSENIINKMIDPAAQFIAVDKKRVWVCDRCGAEMHEKSCKVSCPNCGNRFDCSDLNIYFD